MNSTRALVEEEDCSCVEKLFNRTRDLRNKRTLQRETDIVSQTNVDRHAWAHIFAEFFLVHAHCTKKDCGLETDDILWYVPCVSLGYVSSFMMGAHATQVKVYRRTSKKQPPPGSQSINWSETLYLNVILHQIEYELTCAICTRTSPHNLQILKKYSQRVFACPSRHRMDSKGESEDFTYPNIHFPVDNFEDVFKEITVRDGECVCVELVARDRTGRNMSAIFLGSVRYDILKEVYDSKASSYWRWTQSLVKSTGHKRLEFVIIREPRGRSVAEMAVARVPMQGYQTPVGSSPGYDERDLKRALQEFGRRRRSDTNLTKWNLTTSFYETYNRLAGNKSTTQKCSSETDNAEHWPEIEACNINDAEEEEALDHMWSMRGFSQAWHRLREKRRADCIPLNAYLTYVAIPWTSIVADFFDSKRRPLLTFDGE